MRHVQSHMSDLVIAEIKQDDSVLLLDQLYAEFNAQYERRRFRPALVMGIGQHLAAQFHFADFLECRRRLRPQDRIGVITNHAKDHGPIGPAQPAHNRPRSRRRLFESEPAPPYAGEIRDRCGTSLSAGASRGCGHRLPEGGHRHRGRQRHDQEETPPQ